jgi:23S rRNA pseudouridine2605 synthase
MAKRHEDRKPGQRVARGTGGSSGGSSGGGARGTGSGGKSGPGPRGGSSGGRGSVYSGPGSKGGSGYKGTSGSRGTGSRGTGPATRGPRPGGSRGPGARSDSATPEQRDHKAPRRSKRREQGLVVTPAGAPGKGTNDGKVRLNHFLAMSGICSRRAADGLIAGGRVEVNGELIRELGSRVDPKNDDVRFDGNRIQPERPVYVLFNKPAGIVCTNARNEQKKRVIDFLPEVRGRLFTVGRLDLDSEGLILLTNDGSFALEMTHPRYGVPKLYAVLVRGRIEQHELEKARGGVWLAEGPTTGMNIKVERTGKDKTYLKVTLREGKNREIRRVFAKLEHPVISLKRIRIGDLNLHGLSPGAWRFLQQHEVQRLRDVALQADRPMHDDDSGEN